MPPRTRSRTPAAAARSQSGAAPPTGGKTNNKSSNNRGRRSAAAAAGGAGGRRGAGGNNNNNSNRYNRNKPKPIEPQPITDDPSTLCMVCANRAQDWAIGECGHRICGECAHRLRALYKRDTCVICSQAMQDLYVIPASQWDDSLTITKIKADTPQQNITHDGSIGMSFLKASRAEQFRHLRGFKCSLCGFVCKSANELKSHTLQKHNSIYCQICFDGGKSFIAELELFRLDKSSKSSSALRAHLRKTHPQCQYCKTYFLDDDKLYAHLQEAHETCSICERNGRMHEYYLNFEQLEQHYRRDHYICPHPETCRGVVFETAIELQTHLHTQCPTASNNNSRPRALRVNLQQLHQSGVNDPRPSRRGQNDDRIESERQAARRRAFLSSHVIFSGASAAGGNNESDIISSLTSVPHLPAPAPSQPEPRPSSSSASANQQANGSSSSSTIPAPEISRPPDDGKFHPSPLPRTPDESSSRNAVLVRRMRSLLDPAAYEQFKESSAHFSDGSVDCDEYFDAAIEAFGMRAAVRDVLPELVALLPSPILREPLLRTCLRRTNSEADLDASVTTLVSTTASISTAVSAAPSQGEVQSQSRNNDDGSDNNFPSLNGNAVPRHLIRTPAPLRRFGAPGPEEFPRLGRPNLPAQSSNQNNPRSVIPSSRPNRGVRSARPLQAFPTLSQAHQQPAPRQQSSQPSAAEVARKHSAASVSASANRSKLSNSGQAARTVPNPSASSTVTDASTSSVADAFPSLSISQPRPAAPSPLAYANASASRGSFAQSTRADSSASAPSSAAAPSTAQAQAELASNAYPSLGAANINTNGRAFPALSSPAERPSNNNADPDVSLRAGAVWGGASMTPSRKSKKKGNGRRPASPPRVALERQHQEPTSSQTQERENSSTPLGQSSANRGKLKVIDVVEIARERKRVVEQSALPSIAKSAFSGGRVTSSYAPASANRRCKK